MIQRRRRAGGRRARRAAAGLLLVALAVLLAAGCGGGELSVSDCIARFNELRPPQPGGRVWPSVLVVPRGAAGCTLLFTDGQVFRPLDLAPDGSGTWVATAGEDGPPVPLDRARGQLAGGGLRSMLADGRIDRG